jgi:hypothetical protein
MTKPTDEELERIQTAGEQQEMDRDQYANNAEIDNAGRRALESHGYTRGYYGCIEDLRAHEAARIVADRLRVPMSDVEEALAELADKMENPGSGRPVVTTE